MTMEHLQLVQRPNTPLSSRTRDNDFYHHQDQDRRLPSSLNLVVHDEATSSFYDDSYQIDDGSRDRLDYPEEGRIRLRSDEQSHRDDGYSYYDDDDDRHGSHRSRGSPKMPMLKEEESYCRGEQSYRDDDGYYLENGENSDDVDRYSRSGRHESPKSAGGRDRRSHRDDDYRCDGYIDGNNYCNGRNHGEKSPRTVRGGHSCGRERYQEEDDDYPEGPFPFRRSSRSDSRGGSPGSREGSRDPPSHHDGHHIGTQHLGKIEFSQDPPSGQESLCSNRSRESKGRGGKKKVQLDPSVAGSTPENAPQSTAPISTAIGGSRSRIRDNRGGAISTMSASAITFDNGASTTSSMWSSHDGGAKSKGGRSTYKYSEGGRLRDRRGSYSNDGSSASSEKAVIPQQVSFHKKETVVISNLPGDLEAEQSNQGKEGSVMEMSYNDTKEKSHREGHRDSTWGADKSIFSSSVASKPRPPLRKPDAAKSRELMKGRGKSTRSLAGRSVVSGRSTIKDPKGMSPREVPDAGRSWSRSQDLREDRPRSRSRDLNRGRGRRELKNDVSIDRNRRRSLSRGRATRNIPRDYDDRSRDTRRGRSHDSWRRRRGDPSYVTMKSDRSWRSVRHDMDDEGYCVHHPHVRLIRPRGDDDWRVIRKKCPECIMEDCPSMMGRRRDERSVDRRLYDYNDSHRRRSRSPGRRSLPGDSTYSSYSSYSHHSGDSSQWFEGDSLDAFHGLNMALQTPEEMEEEEATNRLKRRLAARAYHFPGNTWCQDWMQYLSNTHTVLGLFFHHPLHPMGFQERLVILFGSIAIGLTISNFTYLYFIRNGIVVEEEVFTLNSRHTDFTGIPVVSITKLMITLWTLGSFLHTCFDLGLWHMKACTICRYQGRIDDHLVRWGRVVGLFIVTVAIFSGGYAVLLRASIEYKGEGSVADEVEESILQSELYKVQFEDKRSFRFLLGYLVEFVLALFVYYPLAVTVLFSGVLGCGRVPILGGRPREMKRERRYELSKREPKILKAVNIEGEGSNSGGVTTDAETMDDYATSYRDDESRGRFDEDQII